MSKLDVIDVHECSSITPFVLLCNHPLISFPLIKGCLHIQERREYLSMILVLTNHSITSRKRLWETEQLNYYWKQSNFYSCPPLFSFKTFKFPRLVVICVTRSNIFPKFIGNYISLSKHLSEVFINNMQLQQGLMASYSIPTMEVESESTTGPNWLDLPRHLTENILERLVQLKF